ncbi:hypothetical protein GIB67_022146 [Kingdonia uniflora]|uniref:Homeobox domain-containing protein n=1 Tax=Kingdonia uniflora TaxID=39325 RepID=A0A7J7N8M1_9MAGN|nr:hypothetical protein GIB67_022146 [Kingdonia uniflora]
MEDKNDDVLVSSNVSTTPTGSRWTPTKEQITMLEGLYKQGIRTPSADQIQHITSKLKVYGHIEGKNVFYWFQNHKARQRQKQKQEESMVSSFTTNGFNQFLHHKSTTTTTTLCGFSLLPPPSYNNVVYSPFYIAPQRNIGCYPPQYPNVALPIGVRKRTNKLEKTKESDFITPMQISDDSKVDSMNTETLALFPLHPTGILEEKSGICVAASSSSAENSCEIGINEELCNNGGNKPLFNFFPKQH